MTVYSKGTHKGLGAKATACHNLDGLEQLLLQGITFSRSLLWAWIKIRMLLTYAKNLPCTVAWRSTAAVPVRKEHEVGPTHGCWVWKTHQASQSIKFSVCATLLSIPLSHTNLAHWKESNQLQEQRKISLNIAGAVFGLKPFLSCSLLKKKKNMKNGKRGKALCS